MGCPRGTTQEMVRDLKKIKHRRTIMHQGPGSAEVSGPPDFRDLLALSIGVQMPRTLGGKLGPFTISEY